MTTQKIDAIKVAVIVWCIDPEDNIRFLLRHNKPFDGYLDEWSVLFGTVEAGESLQKTAEREIAEEFGIKKFTQLTNLKYQTYYTGRHGYTQVNFFSAQVENIDVKVTLNEESIGYDWVLQNSLSKLINRPDELLAFDKVDTGNLKQNRLNSKSLSHKSDKQLIIYCDGASRGNPGPAASAFVVVNTDEKVIHQQGKLLGQETNNVAEYQAVILALKWITENASKIQTPTFKINLDSQLLYRQIIGQYKVKAIHLRPLYQQIMNLLQALQSRGVNVKFQHQLRNHNVLADQLCNQTLDQAVT